MLQQSLTDGADSKVMNFIIYRKYSKSKEDSVEVTGNFVL